MNLSNIVQTLENTANVADIITNIKNNKEMSEYNEFQKGFVKCKKVWEVLSLGLETGKNVILYGKGGHAKSEMVKKFFEVKGIKPYVKTVGKGTTVEMLFGGLKMKKFLDDGEIEYLVEQSFMAHEHVVFEEFFDLGLQAMEMLKDPLQEKIFRNGVQQYPLNTKFIVACTNRSRSEIIEDDSSKALTERFPLELKVEWETYYAKDYNSMFKKVTGKDNLLFAEVCEACKEKNFISPRTAMHGLTVFEKLSIKGLEYVADFDITELRKLQKNIVKKQAEIKAQEKWNALIAPYKVIPDLTSINDSTKLLQLMKRGNEKLETLSTLPAVSDRNIEEFKEVKEGLMNFVKFCMTKATELAG